MSSGLSCFQETCHRQGWERETTKRCRTVRHFEETNREAACFRRWVKMRREIPTLVENSDRFLVLIVEDSDAQRYVRDLRLKEAGFDTAEANTGPQGLVLARALQPNAILLNVHLPDLYAFDFCRRIKEDTATRDIPVVHIASKGYSPADRARSSSVADAALTGEEPPGVLTATLRALAQLRNIQRQVREAEECTVAVQQTLSAADERFYLTDEHGTGVIFDWNVESGRICYIGPPEAIENYGDNWSIDDWKQRIHSEDRERVLAALQRLLQDHRAYQVRYRLQSRTGSYQHVYSRATALWNERGEAYKVLGSINDITERVLDEEALAHLAAIVEQSDDAIVSHSLDGTMMSWNHGAARLFGYTADEAIGCEPSMLCPPGRLQELASLMAKVKQGQSTTHFETEQLRKDGSIVPVSLTVSPIKDTAGRLIGISSIARDITSYRRAQEAIEAKNRELQRLSGQLLRSQDEERRRIARELHDGAAQVLAGLSLNLANLHAMPLLQECAEARRHIEDSLRLASEGGRELRSLSYVLHPPLLDELGLRSAVESYAEGFAARTGIETRLDLPDLERLPAEVEIALFRIVQESLANAHRHSGTQRVEIRAVVRPEGLAMEIEDSGKGLGAAPEAAEPKGIKFGVGILGMQERARQLGGELTLTSRPGETVVRVWLPLEQHATA